MTRWSWVIDQRKCIGCHACTTACKSENDVAVGVFRTWVKNVDVGTFPDVRRQFAVLRCNHCEDAPCVEICPVTAMYQREDGLVDFAEDRCIGCKACMQACPYDAIYIDPTTHTAEKCNFCSHRVDEGLLPACVVVCPVEALVFGDMDDPTSRVSRELAANPAKVRRPEQRTKPKAFYLGAHPDTLDPLAPVHNDLYAWSDNRRPDGRTVRRSPLPLNTDARPSTVAYDIPKSKPWGWKVSSYIWTKSIAAGAALVPAVMRLMRADTSGPLFSRVAPAIALVFLAITGVLLVADLKRPERFWTILVRPQMRSWLARGAFAITAYGIVLAAWAAAWFLGADTWIDILAGPVALLALLTAVYTAFLFAQCEGRDLWQSRLLVWHLAVHAPIAGMAALMMAAPLTGASMHVTSFASWLGAALWLSVAIALFDLYGKHTTANAEAAADAMVRGPRRVRFWLSLGAGALVPALVLWFAPEQLHFVVAPLILLGLWEYGHAFVLAGQEPPIS
jgi:Fe-S-cluster-containing dehydrogenase component/formate-dependent nitrite reductase membrane component NrfD